MPKTSTDDRRLAPKRSDPGRFALNGATMGTRWSALFHAAPDFNPAHVQTALQAAVEQVDAQMSLWRPGSDLLRLNAAPAGIWHAVEKPLIDVLALGLAVGCASGGAFDIGMGDAVSAWGFGPTPASQVAIRAAMTRPRRPAHELLEVNQAAGLVRKAAPITLDLNGIAKGYGVDRLADTLRDHGIHAGLVGIDGEMRALGLRPDGTPWAIAIEAPDPERRAPHSVIALSDGAIATSGDYRHWVDVGASRLSHTINPQRGAPLAHSPASVTVVAATCAEADAWATALMVLGPDAGAGPARRAGIEALFLLRDGEAVDTTTLGGLFCDPAGGDASPASSRPKKE
jgi:thiamine biosynthesis lipoprotein